MHYCGNKQGLFVAAAELELDVPDLSQVPADQLAATLLPRFFAVWEGEAAFLPLLRAATTTPAAAERLRDVFGEQVEPALRVVAVDRPEQRAALVGVPAARSHWPATCCRSPPLAAMSHEELTRQLVPVIQHYLTVP